MTNGFYFCFYCTPYSRKLISGVNKMACLRPHRKLATELRSRARSPACHSKGTRLSTWPQMVLCKMRIRSDVPPSPLLLPSTQPPNTLILTSFLAAWSCHNLSLSLRQWSDIQKKAAWILLSVRSKLGSEQEASLSTCKQCLKKIKHKTNASNPNCLVGTDILLKRETVDDASCTAGPSHRS